MSVEIPDEDPIILFDGVCNLCSGFVQFLAPRDTDERFHYASLQSDVARDLLDGHEVDPANLESIVLVEGDRCYVKSDAVLRTARHLGGIYLLFVPFGILPRRLRNWVYDFVAARRYRWFGKKDRCMMPTGDLQSRFLEDAEEATRD